MIGRWLALLTEQEEDNLLTTRLVPFTAHDVIQDVGCLVGVALKHRSWGFELSDARTRRLWTWWNGERAMMGSNQIAGRFNELCQKLAGIPIRQRMTSRVSCVGDTQPVLDGAAAAAQLIRARILRHRATRALAGGGQKQPRDAHAMMAIATAF